MSYRVPKKEYVDKKQDDLKRGTFVGDLNDLFVEGTHYADFSNVTNSPTTGYGWIEVIKPSPSPSGIQKIYSHGSDGIKGVYVRQYINSQWYPWKVLKTSAV